MPPVEKFRNALKEFQVDESIVAQILQGYEQISDSAGKPRRAAFFAQAIQRMDELLDAETCHAIRDACACSKGGWRLASSQKIAKEYEGRPLEEKLEALRNARYMGKPTLNENGEILAGIGDEGGLECPCPVFQSQPHDPVSLTYCYCCAGHFRFHYQIALGKKLKTKSVVSSALESLGKRPCRFVYEIIE